MYFLKLGRRIESSVLGGVGKINHSRENRVPVIFVGIKIRKKSLQILCRNFSEFFGKGYNLVPGAFNRPRLVGGNVSRLGGNDPLKGFKQRGYYGFVGLGSARQKKDFGLVVFERRTNLFLGFRAILILAVAGLKIPVAFGKAFYYFGSGALGIVVQKVKHFSSKAILQKLWFPRRARYPRHREQRPDPS